VARDLLVAHALAHLVLPRDVGQQLVERVGDRGSHGWTPTVAQPVIHSSTGS